MLRDASQIRLTYHCFLGCAGMLRYAHAVQVATTATFSACALEALRMLLADLEQPGGTLTTPFKAPMALLFPIALALLPTILPAGFVGNSALQKQLAMS